MTDQQVVTRLRGVPPLRRASLTLAVISDDETLARRAALALERDGMVVRVLVAAPGVRSLAHSERVPELVLVRREWPALAAVMREVRALLPNAGIVAVVPRREQPAGFRVPYDGPYGLVPEADLATSLASVARAVAANYVCVPAEVRHVTEPPALSLRERQVLGLAVAGLTNAQIGKRIYLAESTVKAHVSAAYRKLGIHSRREAAALVLSSNSEVGRMVLGTLRLSDAFGRRAG